MTAKLAAMCGVLGALWMLGMTLIGGANFPGYDHGAQFISELGANGAPHGQLVSWLGFGPTGALVTAFAVFAWVAVPRSVMSTLGFIGIVLFAVGYLGATVFRCDFGCRPEAPSFSQQMHNLFGLSGYVFAAPCMLMLGLASRKWPGAGMLPLLALIAAPVVFSAFAMLLQEDSLSGLWQRIIEASVLGWVVACSLYLARRGGPERLR